MLFTLLPLLALSQGKGGGGKDNISFHFGTGLSQLVGSGFDGYYGQRLNPMLQTVCSHELDFSGFNHTFSAELDMKAVYSDFRFDNLHDGVVSQGVMGLNMLFNLKPKTKNSPVDFFVGPGIYSVLGQTRTPKNPTGGVSKIDDKFFPYCGLSLNASVSFSVPVDSYRVGAALRMFYHPDVTFLNSNSTPEFNSMGAVVAAFIRFNR